MKVELYLIKPNVSRMGFMKEYFHQKNTKQLFCGIALFLLVGPIFFYLGVYFHNVYLFDVLFLFLGLGMLVFLLALIAPLVAYKKFSGKRLRIDGNLQILKNEKSIKEIPFNRVRVIYFMNHATVLDFKGFTSISIYSPSEDDVQRLKHILKNTHIKSLEAETFLSILLRKFRVLHL